MTKAFLIISLIAALVCAFFTAMPLWVALLMLPLCFILLLLPLVLMIMVAAAQVDTSKPLEKRSRLSGLCCAAIVDLLCTLGLMKISVTGKEKLPEDGQFLIVSNHRSAADPMALYKVLGEYAVGFVSKPSNMALPVLGKMAYGAGFLAIDRENDRNALKTILTAASYLKSGICSMCIYPEGTRSRNGELLPFHAGSFKIAQRAKAPVAVLCTSGTEKQGKNLRKLKLTPVRLDILEVIDPERVESMSSVELAEYSRGLIARHLETIE